jgi:triosephosphate isomerase
MSPKTYVMANWKMNGSVQAIEQLLERMALEHEPLNEHVVIFPPYVYLSLVQKYQNHAQWQLGAQNVYPVDHGAFTGEISGPMLADMGCKFVLVGHSERRTWMGESDKFIAEKFQHVKDCGMMPVLCVGETLEQRQQGATQAVLTQQLEAIYQHTQTGFDHAVIAYEPVWAIGTGLSANLEQVQEAHALIRSVVRKHESQVANTLSILYGGSVTPETAQDLFQCPEVQGGLVGGASLDAERFLGIIRCIKSYY